MGDDPLYLKFWSKLIPFNRFSLVAPQP